MEKRTIVLVVAAFFLSTVLGFASHTLLQNGDSEYTESFSLRADTEDEVVNTTFDGDNYLELRHEEAPKARFYFKTQQEENAEQIEDLKHDGTLQTTTKIRSFGNKTYFLYLRYMDNPNQSEDGYMELYRIEET
ncbi:hypothetical protein [Candidatus Nanohalobium constans]|uniref:Uncharacterized protein n=1 Tax=Candidatus Nanohalobium constans TaxID=2565781 RepID=A0A5Q0UH13_9ARCH|nr:hypothetical protein [Candidatus Nanohalobium constans]QGA80500.1 hypothetical protein LC1Nh_0606 [Candidatus Nanohalobium constans]